MRWLLRNVTPAMCWAAAGLIMAAWVPACAALPLAAVLLLGWFADERRREDFAEAWEDHRTAWRDACGFEDDDT